MSSIQKMEQFLGESLELLFDCDNDAESVSMWIIICRFIQIYLAYEDPKRRKVLIEILVDHMKVVGSDFYEDPEDFLDKVLKNEKGEEE